MKNLFVVTHPQSIHHVEDKVGGWYDTGLTDLGRRQAAAIGERLAAEIGRREVEIFSSDLKRASETADVIAARLGVSVTTTVGLREISYGIAEGEPQAFLDESRTPPWSDNRLEDRGGIAGAESRRDVATRVYTAMDIILDGGGCDTQVIVTHGFALTFVVSHWIGMPLEATGSVSFPAASGSITHLRQDDFWKSRAVLWLADVSHLER